MWKREKRLFPHSLELCQIVGELTLAQLNDASATNLSPILFSPPPSSPPPDYTTFTTPPPSFSHAWPTRFSRNAFRNARPPPPLPPPPWIIERNKKRVFFFFIEKSYTNTIQRGIIVFLSFPDGKLRKIIRVFKYRIRLKEGRENNFGRFSRSLRLSYVTRMQPPLLAHLRLAHWLSRNNHDPRADSVPYFQQLIRLPGRRRRRRRDLRFVAFIRGELQAGTGYRYSSLNVYRVVCASNSTADLRL